MLFSEHYKVALIQEDVLEMRLLYNAESAVNNSVAHLKILRVDVMLNVLTKKRGKGTQGNLEVMVCLLL